jgi:hypothetical protein
LNQTWSAYAAANGMQFRPAEDDGEAVWAPLSKARVEAVIDSVPIAFECADFQTSFLCRPIAPLAVQVELSRRGVLSRIAHYFGARALALGDPSFDDAFAVTATDEDTARWLLGEPIRNDLLALYPLAFSYDGGDRGRAASAQFVLRGMVTDSATLDTAVALLAALGNVRVAISAYR